MKPVAAVIEPLPGRLKAACIATHDFLLFHQRDTGATKPAQLKCRAHARWAATQHQDGRFTH